MVSFHSASSVCVMPFLYAIAANNRCLGVLSLTLSGCLWFFDEDIVERGDYENCWRRMNCTRTSGGHGLGVSDAFEGSNISSFTSDRGSIDYEPLFPSLLDPW